MEIKAVKRNLGKAVRFSSSKHHTKNAEYTLTACIIRKDERGNFIYTAELTDVKQPKSVCIVPLAEIKEENDG